MREEGWRDLAESAHDCILCVCVRGPACVSVSALHRRREILVECEAAADVAAAGCRVG